MPLAPSPSFRRSSSRWRAGVAHQCGHVSFLGHIGADELGLRAGGTQLDDERGAGVVAAAGDDEVGAFAGKGQRGGAANAGQGAGDQDGGGGVAVHLGLFVRGWGGDGFTVVDAGNFR